MPRLTSTMTDVSNGQGDLFRTNQGPKIGVLNLRGTASTVAEARNVQWSSYGLSVLLDEIGINVGSCTVDTMDQFEIVLYSVTSPVDQLTMAAEMPTSRKCKVIVGGQGSYPIWALTDIVDVVHFGRAEGAANQIILTDEVTPYQWTRSRDPDLSDRYLVRPMSYLHPSEHAVGCKQACTFCQYGYTRQTSEQKGSYSAGGHGYVVKEDSFAHIDLSKPGRVTTALDGWSEQTRMMVKKGITNNFLIRRLRECIETVPGTITLKVFQIIGYPWESPESITKDLEAMRDVLSQADSNHKTIGRLVVMFVTTPFSPEPLTPMEDARANIEVNWRHHLTDNNKCKQIWKGTNIEAFTLPQIQSPVTLAKRVAINRGASREQVIAMARCRTIEEIFAVTGDLYGEGKGRRVSSYLGLGFDLPRYKQKLLSGGKLSVIQP